MENTKSAEMDEKDFNLKFINPKEIIDRLEIFPGMSIAEFGCGTGFFVFPTAKKVSPGGRVYALDILKEKLETVKSQASLNGMSNIFVERVNLEKIGGSKLPDESMDWVFMVNMLFQNKDKGLVIEEAKRVLKPKGRILIIEWNKEDAAFGPSSSVKLSKSELVELAGKSELAALEEVKISDFHFGLILAKYK